jgi:hypothetical protein
LHPWGGWITYLCPSFTQLITPPTSAIVEPVSNGGMLMLVTEGQFDSEDPAHVAVSDAIQTCLEPAQKVVLAAKKPWRSMHRT